MSALVCEACGVPPYDPSPGCRQPHEVAGVAVIAPVSTPKFVVPPVVQKPKAPQRWRGVTAVELGRDGARERVFHRTASGREAWTHPYAEKGDCEACLRS